MTEKMKLCPCRNTDITTKLSRVKEVIENPSAERLRDFALLREEYDLLLPSAIASLTGQQRALAQKPREDFVRALLFQLRNRGELVEVEDMTHIGGRRFDFRVRTSGKRVVVVEVKGAEGNSVTLGDRPPGTDEFVVWCHLTGSLQKHPAEEARAIIGRLVKVMVNESEQSKRYDVLVIWDTFCGSDIRQCPEAAGKVIPCFFLFPQQQPTIATPHPPLHTLTTTDLPQMLLRALEVPKPKWETHTWQVEIELLRPKANWMRQLTYHHPGTNQSWAGPPNCCRPLQVPVVTR